MEFVAFINWFKKKRHHIRLYSSAFKLFFPQCTSCTSLTKATGILKKRQNGIRISGNSLFNSAFCCQCDKYEWGILAVGSVWSGLNWNARYILNHPDFIIFFQCHLILHKRRMRTNLVTNTKSIWRGSSPIWIPASISQSAAATFPCASRLFIFFK